jgi:putative restriction endonuclease
MAMAWLEFPTCTWYKISCVITDPAARWRDALSDLHTWKRGAERAPHKPLLTLLLLARAEFGGANKVRFVEVRDRLDQLLREFGPSRRSHHPELPFWHLQYDGIWSVEGGKELPLKKGGHSPARSTLERNDVAGHVPEDLWQALRKDSGLRQELTEKLLRGFWPETLHSAIRQAVGLPDEVDVGVSSMRTPRDPQFREEVLRAYERRCVVCGYDGRLADTLLGIDAAHIRWRAYSGPDVIANGLALCSLHHVALDSGAIGISPQRTVLVSCDVTGLRMVEEYLCRFAGKRLRPPQGSFPGPGDGFIEWHRKQVFHAPERKAVQEGIASRTPLAAEDEQPYGRLEIG